jgi:hypothetical protein
MTARKRGRSLGSRERPAIRPPQGSSPPNHCGQESVGRQPSLASTLRVCPQAGKTQMKRSMRPWPAAARTSTASAQRHRRSSEIAKRHRATSTQICARLAAPSFAGDAADSRHPFTRAPEEKSRRARDRTDRRRARRPPLGGPRPGCLRVAVSGLHRRPPKKATGGLDR